MTKVRVESLTVSLDGYLAGPDQSLENPLGVGGPDLHAWAFATRTFQQKVLGADAGSTGIDDDFAQRGFHNIGAWILGRNMFGPIRGQWPNDEWKGWWGKHPPYQVPVYILTHYPREPIIMDGGTVFYFETNGIESALQKAHQAAEAKDIRIGGGANAIRQFLRAGLIDEMHIAVAPVILGAGEPLFNDLNLRALGYICRQHTGTKLTTHYIISKENT